MAENSNLEFENLKRQERLEAILNNVVDGIITINNRGIVEEFNLACEGIFGYKKEEVIGQNVKILMPSEYANDHDQYVGSYNKTREAKIIGIGRTVKGKKKNGEIFPMELSVSEVNVGDQRFYSGIIKDITAREKTRQDLEDKVSFLSLAESMAKIGHWELNLKTDEVFWSDEIYNIHEVEKGEYIPELASAIKFYHPDDIKKVQENIEKAIEDREGFEFQMRIITPAGEIKDVRSQGVVNTNKKGSAISIFGVFQDVSEQAEYKRKLLESKQTVDSYIEATNNGYWDWYIQEDYEYMSPRFWEILGYLPHEKKHHPSEWQELIFPDDLEIALENFNKHIATKGAHPFDQEARYKHKNGSTVWVACKGKVVSWDNNGNPIRMIGTHADVTEKKQEDMVLNKIYSTTLDDSVDLNQKMHLVLDSVNDYLGLSLGIISNIEGDHYEVEYVSEHEDLKGGEVFELEDTYCMHTFRMGEVKAWHDASQSEILTHPCYKNFGLKTYIGTTIFVNGEEYGTLNFTMPEAREQPFTEREKTFINVIARWVGSEIERASHIQKIKESENFLKLVTENNPDLLFVKDSEFRIVQANKSFINLYPKERRDKIIGYTTFEDYPHEEVDEFLKMDKAAFDQGYSETMENITFPDEKTRKLFTQKIRFNNSKGEAFILGISRDVTEREQLIEKLATSNLDLERFAYIASHDLQEPLRMINNYTGLLKSDFEDDLSERQEKMFYFVQNGAAHMQSLISDILEYSKISDEDRPAENFSSNDIIESAIENLSVRIEESKAEIKLCEPIELTGHSIRFLRLVQNLISNGLKYHLADAVPKIIITSEIYQENQNLALFCIEDNGIGINPKYFKQIFEPFKRLHNRFEYSGTGIGLPICKKIVESEGGSIWLESEEGDGAKFYFTYPRKVKNYS